MTDESSTALVAPPVPTLGKAEIEFMRGVCIKVLKDSPEVEDVLQDACITAVRHLGQFRGDSKLTTWLYRVAITAALMHLRKRKRRNEGGDLIEPDTLISPLPSPEDELRGLELQRQMNDSAGKLNNKYHDILRLRAQGYREAEISEQLNLNPATVKTRTYRGLKKGLPDMATKYLPGERTKKVREWLIANPTGNYQGYIDATKEAGISRGFFAVVKSKLNQNSKLKVKKPAEKPAEKPAQTVSPPSDEAIAKVAAAVNDVPRPTLPAAAIPPTSPVVVKIEAQSAQASVTVSPHEPEAVTLREQLRQANDLINKLEDDNAFLRWWCEGERQRYVVKLLKLLERGSGAPACPRCGGPTEHRLTPDGREWYVCVGCQVKYPATHDE